VTSFDDPRYEKYSQRLARLRSIRKYMYRMDILECALSYDEVTEIFVQTGAPTSHARRGRSRISATKRLTADVRMASALGWHATRPSYANLLMPPTRRVVPLGPLHPVQLRLIFSVK
jgi:hypothetical protein